MTRNLSLFLLALGAILDLAVTRAQVGWVDIHTMGAVLMVIGAVGLLYSLFLERS